MKFEESLCKKCLGCNRLGLKTFQGVYRCKNFMKGTEEDEENRNPIQAT